MGGMMFLLWKRHNQSALDKDYYENVRFTSGLRRNWLNKLGHLFPASIAGSITGLSHAETCSNNLPAHLAGHLNAGVQTGGGMFLIPVTCTLQDVSRYFSVC